MKPLPTWTVLLIVCGPAFARDPTITDLGKQRAETLRTNVSAFRLHLTCESPSDKPYYQLLLSVPDLPPSRRSAFFPQHAISRAQAKKIIDYLARSGSLNDAKKPGELEKLPKNSCLLRIEAGPLQVSEFLSRDLPMLRRLDGLTKVLEGEAGKSLDLLLDRFKGVRRQLARTEFDIASGRHDTRIRIDTEGAKTVFDVTSNFGIDTVTIKRRSSQWPPTVLVRLRLKGLESFRASNGSVTIEWSVSNTGSQAKTVALLSGNNASSLDSNSPYYTHLKIIGRDDTIPLGRGSFDVPLPAKLFEKNPQGITLRWIDFFRN